MGFELNAEDAARELDHLLRGHSWYLSTGIAATDHDTVLIVYVKSERHRELKAFSDGWHGYKVSVKRIGLVRQAVQT